MVTTKKNPKRNSGLDQTSVSGSHNTDRAPNVVPDVLRRARVAGEDLDAKMAIFSAKHV